MPEPACKVLGGSFERRQAGIMKKQSWLIVLTLVSVALVSIGWMPTTGVRAQGAGVNLLTNGDFEASGGQAWPFQDGISEVQVAPGWRAFFLDTPPAYAKIPVNCPNAQEDPGCYWARPEFRGLSAIEFSYRVHGGNLAQKYFTFGRQHEAGMLQQVNGITPGTLLRFSVYIETWSCMPGSQWNVCPTAPNSNSPAPMHTKVGMDPTGGTNPWAASVVWSPEINAYDQWTLFQVEATAANSTVTVFIYSRADWTDQIFRLNNDVYVDDASLVVVGPAPTPSPPPQPTATYGPPPTPRPTPTPRPDGAVVHVVQLGDTLYGIAYEYNVSPDQIIRLNNITDPGMLSVGQELVIALPTNPPTPTMTPALTPAPTTPAALAPTVAPAGAGLCVLVYQDRNGDTFRQADTEELLPGAVVSVLGAAGAAALSYTTDGLKEPYCFTDLPAGQYRVSIQSPAGYQASGPSDLAVIVSAAGAPQVELGVKRSEVISVTTPQPGATQPSAEKTPVGGDKVSTGGLSKALRTVVTISGGLVLVLAVAVGVLFLRSRPH